MDIGAHRYGLTHGEDANWYLKTEGELTQTAKSVRLMPALHLSIVNAGMNELRKRLGDLRSGSRTRPPASGSAATANASGCMKEPAQD